tara:strand:- start:443 stop:988 length:546 start_codon:yes stop_codon:yes gene_type:complete
MRDTIHPRPNITVLANWLISLAVTFFFFLPLYAGSTDENSWLTMEFSESDDKYLTLSRERINQLTQTLFGARFHGERAHDIALLQRLLDEKRIAADNRQLLQSMGVILADLMMFEFNLKWVIYLDHYGRSRALQIKHSEYFLFPITIISRRAETGLAVDIDALYDTMSGRVNDYYQRQRYD